MKNFQVTYTAEAGGELKTIEADSYDHSNRSLFRFWRDGNEVASIPDRVVASIEVLEHRPARAKAEPAKKAAAERPAKKAAAAQKPAKKRTPRKVTRSSTRKRSR